LTDKRTNIHMCWFRGLFVDSNSAYCSIPSLWTFMNKHNLFTRLSEEGKHTQPSKYKNLAEILPSLFIHFSTLPSLLTSKTTFAFTCSHSPASHASKQEPWLSRVVCCSGAELSTIPPTYDPYLRFLYYIFTLLLLWLHFSFYSSGIQPFLFAYPQI
jgi:hypothetical protein